MRLLIADDSALMRAGLVSLVTAGGHDVVATAGDAAELADAIRVTGSTVDVAILDVRMPPTQTDEGARAALQLRRDHPGVGILLLSQHVEAHYAVRVMREHPAGFGYLLKDRVLDIDELLDALERINSGGFVVDPVVVTQLMQRRSHREVLGRLTPRETDVLSLIAEGMSNSAISQRRRLSGKTVENHISSIFAKLDLPDTAGDHRRVRAVLLYLSSNAASG